MQPTRNEIIPLYQAIVIAGIIALLVFFVGGVEFFIFEPVGQHTGLMARIEGVNLYRDGHVDGSPRNHYSREEAFAAVVDWKSIPPDLEVTARWFNGFGELVGSVPPAPAGQMPPDPVPVKVPAGLDKNLPGTYLFVVERVVHGQPVEVLGREFVKVERR